jgi:hypothetical protein
MKLPAPGWILIASGICSGLLSVLSGEQFAGQLWVPVALAALAAIIKWLGQQVVREPTRQVGPSSGSSFVRFWLG